jgi:hypothetical protein
MIDNIYKFLAETFPTDFASWLLGEAIAQKLSTKYKHLLRQPDCDRFKALFSISANRELLVTAIDLLTQQKLLSDRPVAKLT